MMLWPWEYFVVSVVVLANKLVESDEIVQVVAVVAEERKEEEVKEEELVVVEVKEVVVVVVVEVKEVVVEVKGDVIVVVLASNWQPFGFVFDSFQVDGEMCDSQFPQTYSFYQSMNYDWPQLDATPPLHLAVPVVLLPVHSSIHCAFVSSTVHPFFWLPLSFLQYSEAALDLPILTDFPGCFAPQFVLLV